MQKKNPNFRCSLCGYEGDGFNIGTLPHTFCVGKWADEDERPLVQQFLEQQCIWESKQLRILCPRCGGGWFKSHKKSRLGRRSSQATVTEDQMIRSTVFVSLSFLIS